MAPVKRTASTVQRETRNTRAAAVAKKKAVGINKEPETLVATKTRNIGVSQREAVETRQRKKISAKVESGASYDTEEPSPSDEQIIASSETRATRATTSAKGLAAAPRRRVRVKPLDAHTVESTPPADPTEDKKRKEKEGPQENKATRSKTAASDVADVVVPNARTSKTESKSTRKRASKRDDEQAPQLSKPKTKGRPKSQKSSEKAILSCPETETTITKRTTRSQRVGSTVSVEEAKQETTSDATKSVTGVRKKVTFQDLPTANDKENQPLPQSKAKKVTATPSIGLRAKPLRRTAASTTAARTRKAGSNGTKTSSADSQDASEQDQSKIARILTPKKITQVAKSSSPVQQEPEVSEGEDELNGGKTPIRDLSVSPKRPASAALARLLPPAKRLDFGQSLVPKSPDRTALFGDNAVQQSGVLASPARRPDTSSFRNGLKTTPMRGLNESSMVLFPSQREPTTSVALNALTTNGAVPTASTMLQSPKRAGVLGPTFFSQSTTKKPVSKPLFKASLFGTPAKRLFSPIKERSSTIAQNKMGAGVVHVSTDNDLEADGMELESEVTASSHFRSSSSPLRVSHVGSDIVGFDFDDSVLQVRSPLKIQKNPAEVNTRPELGIPASVKEIVPRTRSSTMSSINEALEQPALDTAHQEISRDAGDDKAEHLHSAMRSTSEARLDTQPGQRGSPKTEHVSPQPLAMNRPFMPQLLFRSADTASDDESSEDELACGRTLMDSRADKQPRVSNIHPRSRLSTGIPPSISGKDIGFTPLAAQMSGWLASSPEKSPEQHETGNARHTSVEFSPLARQHIDGEVLISRDSTPVQKLSKRMSMAPASLLNSITSSKRPSNLRQSVIQRQSFGFPSNMESPARNPQFEEYMEIRALEEQTNCDVVQDDFPVSTSEHGFDNIMALSQQTERIEDAEETILDSENEDNNDRTAEAGDLTTDLINFTHASDTAMVDFQRLAEEADEMASECIDHDIDGDDPTGDVVSAQDEDASASSSPITSRISSVLSLENEGQLESDEPAGIKNVEASITTFDEPTQQLSSPVLQAVTQQLDSPSLLVIDAEGSALTSPSSPVYSSVNSPVSPSVTQTPRPNLGLNERRIINTVTSKVPLKPEGSISPLKMPRKRSRSFGNTDSSPAKRISFENLKALPPISTVTTIKSPDRRVRTSVAPSPGGTSTPATIKSYTSQADRYSLGGVSTVTTPGQKSFSIEDFGDSTLDGIELPEDFEGITQQLEESESPAQSRSASVCASSPTTPRPIPKATPTTARRGIHRATTPAGSMKKASQSSRKPPRTSTGAGTQRIPLEPVGKGILHGAVVFVDVHTSEGADASGIFIELLTQMGAKCVKEWRWNPRASLSPEGDHEAAEQKIGITHVVFKDGGKRTLEKVRDAKGGVCCVGVAWVLDCERENKWLDESNYTIDTTVLPRGGSKRRKSMEPRALLVGNDGSVSASRPRRSVSAEMNELMKRELINTPARGQSLGRLEDGEDEENDEDTEQATPTGFVSYDPRVAMTPGTPYLVSQGKKLTQMSAPPKQHNKSLFEDGEEEAENTFLEGERGSSGVVRDARKFRMKNLGDMVKRRRTLGWKPPVGSPLGKQ